MRPMIMTLGAAALFAASAGSAQAASVVEIKDAVARVTVMPEDRADVKVSFITTNQALPMVIRTQGDRLVVDGDLRRKIRSCRSSDDKHSVHVRGVGNVSWDNIPQMVVRVPRNARVRTSGAVFGVIGRGASALNLGNAGCGDWTVANVGGPVSIDIAGSGDVRAGSVGKLELDIAGAGDVDVRAVGAGGADIDIAGSGDVRIANHAGPLDVSIAGAGDVRVAQGRAANMDVEIAGSGDVRFDGVAASLEVSIAGSGDVRVGNVTGPVKRSVLGSGSIIVNGQEIKRSRD